MTQETKYYKRMFTCSHSMYILFKSLMYLLFMLIHKIFISRILNNTSNGSHNYQSSKYNKCTYTSKIVIKISIIFNNI
jgi:hypothetical protein